MKVWNKKPWVRNQNTGNVSFQMEDIFELNAGQHLSVEINDIIHVMVITDLMIRKMQVKTKKGVDFYIMPYDLSTTIDEYAA